LQGSLFWLTGALFFLVQLGILMKLLRARAAEPSAEARHVEVEIVWTLVPASLIAALALMLGGLTTSPWAQIAR
jgi:heme/copper-type cytochrome/quinol oxidase subunit 2